eukprot:TRINITY_DN72083_c0_g1_i1.p1 TRINITY_DN72083_c0_g1~~TRINITY_DN72083_c0_g1_i1.p1  ORF type:complete len:306 (+),score=82.87 TRINITY_DN72083_c0_g1_i1:42-920(+)
MADLVLFRDLYKPFKDFNSKAFDAGKSKVEYKAAAAPKSPYKSSLVIDFLKSSYELLLEFPFQPIPQLPRSVLKAKALHPDQKLELTGETKHDGWTVTKVLTSGASKRADFSLTVHKEMPENNFNSSLVLESKGLDLASSLALVSRLPRWGLTAGVQGVARAPGGDFGKLATDGSMAFRARCGTDMWGATIDKKNIAVAWLHKVASSSHQMFLECKTTHANLLRQPTFAVGWEDVNKTSPMKARLEIPTGLLQLSYGIPVSANLKATVSTEVRSFDVGRASFGLHILFDNTV